jgi:hypothetical protein
MPRNWIARLRRLWRAYRELCKPDHEIERDVRQWVGGTDDT